MGGEVSKNRKKKGPPTQRRFSQGFLSNVAQRLGHSAVFSQPGEVDQMDVPKVLLPPDDREEMPEEEKTPPALISLFLPEFPQHKFPSEDCFQVLSVIAKGSLGPILKIKVVNQEKIWAVKVLPKSEILKHGVLEQSKEEVIIQRQLKHPFIHSLQDCWQTQRHLFIMFDYCSAGDLYTYWLLKGQFDEDEVRLLAAELGSALGFLHNLGIIHRDVKMENILLSDQGHIRLSDFGLSRRLNRGGRAFTACRSKLSQRSSLQRSSLYEAERSGLPVWKEDSRDPITVVTCSVVSGQNGPSFIHSYGAPEVLSGGPYSHAADWWSLGVLLFSLVAGEFPVAAESNHISMLKKVRDCPYVPAKTFSSDLILLLGELLCKTPASRLHNLQRFRKQAFFRGTTFDSYLLQKTPVKFILKLRSHPDWVEKSRRGSSTDWFDHFDFDNIFSSSSNLTELLPISPSEEMDLTAEQD